MYTNPGFDGTDRQFELLLSTKQGATSKKILGSSRAKPIVSYWNSRERCLIRGDLEGGSRSAGADSVLLQPSLCWRPSSSSGTPEWRIVASDLNPRAGQKESYSRFQGLSRFSATRCVQL